jgi:hypothetical protein
MQIDMVTSRKAKAPRLIHLRTVETSSDWIDGIKDAVTEAAAVARPSRSNKYRWALVSASLTNKALDERP